MHDLKERIRTERLRVVFSANAAMTLLYWDIGQVILRRQEREGWGAKVIDRLATDLREAFPDMQGLSARNLKYMRKFAEAWPDRAIVQRAAAQIPWRNNQALLDKLAGPAFVFRMDARHRNQLFRVFGEVSHHQDMNQVWSIITGSQTQAGNPR